MTGPERGGIEERTGDLVFVRMLSENRAMVALRRSLPDGSCSPPPAAALDVAKLNCESTLRARWKKDSSLLRLRQGAGRAEFASIV